MSQNHEENTVENVEPIQINMSQFLHTVGGQKKQRVYGLGSQAKKFYPDSFSSSSSSRLRYAPPYPAVEERLRQIREEHEEIQ